MDSENPRLTSTVNTVIPAEEPLAFSPCVREQLYFYLFFNRNIVDFYYCIIFEYVLVLNEIKSSSRNRTTLTSETGPDGVNKISASNKRMGC